MNKEILAKTKSEIKQSQRQTGKKRSDGRKLKKI